MLQKIQSKLTNSAWSISSSPAPRSPTQLLGCKHGLRRRRGTKLDTHHAKTNRKPVARQSSPCKHLPRHSYREHWSNTGSRVFTLTVLRRSTRIPEACPQL